MSLELKRLSEILTITPDFGTDESFSHCKGYYSHWCRYKCTAVQFSNPDSVVLVHGPQGCVGNERAFLVSDYSQYHGTPFRFTPVTNMNVSDTILGAEDKLRQAIREVDRIYRPKVLYIFVTCCAGVIKEPVEDIVEEMHDKVEARLIVVRAEGFVPSIGSQPYQVQKACENFKEPGRKIPRSVNILGITKEVHAPGRFPEDSNEMERLLNKIGVTVNTVLFQTVPVEDFERATEAEFNTIICPQWGYPMAKIMQDEYGMPHGMGFNPIGIEATSKWLMEVAEFFGLEEQTRKVIDEEVGQIKEIWEDAKRIVNGKYMFCDGGDPMTSVGRNIAWARAGIELGMEPILFNLPDVEIKGKFHHIAFALQDGIDPLAVYTDRYSHHRRLSPVEVAKELNIKIEDIGLYVGDVFPRAIANDWTEPIWDPSNVPRLITATHLNKNRQSPGRRTGFRGAERFARDIINANKKRERKKLPTLLGRIRGV